MQSVRYRTLTALGADRGAGQIRRYLRTGDPYPERWERLASWLEPIDRRSVPDTGRQILMFSVLPYWTDLCLAVAAVLVHQGHRVDFVWMPYLRYDKPFSLVNSLHDRIARSFPSPVQHPRLRVINLLQVQPLRLDTNLMNQVETQSVIDAAYMTRRGEINTRSRADRRLVRYRKRRNAFAMGSLLRILDEGNYDSVLTPHGNILEFGVARRAAQERHVDPLTFEFSDEKQAIISARGEPCVLLNTEAAWAADAPHLMTPDRRRRADEFMAVREGIDWPGYHLALQSSAKTDVDADQLAVSDDKPLFLMCPGAAWDALHLNLPGYPFGSMLEWVRETVRFFSLRHDCYLIVRCHPVETMRPTTQRMVDVVEEAMDGPRNYVRVIPPEDPVNTYALMHMATAGIAYTSTSGLEMLMRGIEVVIGGPAHYGNKGFTKDFRTSGEYFHAIEDIIRAYPRVDRLTPRRIDLAQCYADVLRNWTRPFPWSMDDFFDDVALMPPAAVVKDERAVRFLQTFDFLSGESSEDVALR